MSDLAKKLRVAPLSEQRVRRGPSNVCSGVYTPDLEDYAEIQRYRTLPQQSWATAQAKWDEIAGIPPERRITNDKFRYHWRRKCWCWPDDLRLS